MTTTGIVVIAAMVVAAVTSAVIGAYGVRARRRTTDFLVAGRTVHPAANAAAISGEYLSAASFLGVAGLILRDGVDALRGAGEPPTEAAQERVHEDPQHEPRKP